MGTYLKYILTVKINTAARHASYKLAKMADQQAKDEAAKNRIISHMNADHHDSIVRYLEHFCKIPSWTADSGKMTDIDLRSMTFSCGGGRKTYSITLNPPMTSYRDARERAVQLDQQARPRAIRHHRQGIRPADRLVRRRI